MAACDQCERVLYPQDAVLHCPPNTKHGCGYDLCVQCADKMLVHQQKEILRSVYKQSEKKKKSVELSNRKKGRSRASAILPNLNTNIPMNTSTNSNQLHMLNRVQTPTRTPSPRKRKRDGTLDLRFNGSRDQKRQRMSKSPSHSQDGVPTFKDWEEHLMSKEFIDNYKSYLRNAPNLHESAIQSLNNHSSWLDFNRLTNGPEIEILNILVDLETVTHLNATRIPKPPRTYTHAERTKVKGYLENGNVDFNHIWQSKNMQQLEEDDHDAIARYASSAIAHNSIHDQLFGDHHDNKGVNGINSNSNSNSNSPRSPSSATSTKKDIEWSQISKMIEQSHFIRDWKLNKLDTTIRKQINILQALIAANATPKNNLSSNNYSGTKEDFILNVWKQHVIKLRNIMIRHGVSLEYPMNVLKYDRTEIDHIAKISAMNGIQHLIEERVSGKPPLPRSAMTSSNTSLKLKDLLPNPSNQHHIVSAEKAQLHAQMAKNVLSRNKPIINAPANIGGTNSNGSNGSNSLNSHVSSHVSSSQKSNSNSNSNSQQMSSRQNSVNSNSINSQQIRSQQQPSLQQMQIPPPFLIQRNSNNSSLSPSKNTSIPKPKSVDTSLSTDRVQQLLLQQRRQQLQQQMQRQQQSQSLKQQQHQLRQLHDRRILERMIQMRSSALSQNNNIGNNQMGNNRNGNGVNGVMNNGKPQAPYGNGNGVSGVNGVMNNQHSFSQQLRSNLNNLNQNGNAVSSNRPSNLTPNTNNHNKGNSNMNANTLNNLPLLIQQLKNSNCFDDPAVGRQVAQLLSALAQKANQQNARTQNVQNGNMRNSQNVQNRNVPSNFTLAQQLLAARGLKNANGLNGTLNRNLSTQSVQSNNSNLSHIRDQNNRNSGGNNPNSGPGFNFNSNHSNHQQQNQQSQQSQQERNKLTLQRAMQALQRKQQSRMLGEANRKNNNTLKAASSDSDSDGVEIVKVKRPRPQPDLTSNIFNGNHLNGGGAGGAGTGSNVDQQPNEQSIKSMWDAIHHNKGSGNNIGDNIVWPIGTGNNSNGNQSQNSSPFVSGVPDLAGIAGKLTAAMANGNHSQNLENVLHQLNASSAASALRRNSSNSATTSIDLTGNTPPSSSTRNIANRGNQGGNGNDGSSIMSKVTDSASTFTVKSSSLEMPQNPPPPPNPSKKGRNNKIDTRKIGQVYSDKKYWDQFHRDHPPEYFEWFCHYEEIMDILGKYIGNKQAKILEIGCGLSSMASKMVLDGGYRDIQCLDWCQIAVNKINAILLDEHPPGTPEHALLQESIQYTVQDIRSMSFGKRTFDVIIDKGTMDAIDCGVPLSTERTLRGQANKGIENYADNFEEVVAICARMHEILKPNGLFIIITSRSISKRIEFVDELKATHKRLFKKLYAEPVQTELKDWRDGDSKTPKLIILRAIKHRRHKKACAM